MPVSGRGTSLCAMVERSWDTEQLPQGEEKVQAGMAARMGDDAPGDDGDPCPA